MNTRSRAEPVLLRTPQMAAFAARGFLRLDEVVPEPLNRAFLQQVDDVPAEAVPSIREHYGRIIAGSAIPRVAAGTPLADAYPPDSPIAAILELPRIRGAIESLVGQHAIFDHHFLHVVYPPRSTARREASRWLSPTTRTPPLIRAGRSTSSSCTSPTRSLQRWAAHGFCPAPICGS